MGKYVDLYIDRYIHTYLHAFSVMYGPLNYNFSIILLAHLSYHLSGQICQLRSLASLCKRISMESLDIFISCPFMQAAKYVLPALGEQCASNTELNRKARFSLFFPLTSLKDFIFGFVNTLLIRV